MTRPRIISQPGPGSVALVGVTSDGELMCAYTPARIAPLSQMLLRSWGHSVHGLVREKRGG